MRLWYQSMSRSKAWGLYHETLTELIERTKGPDVEVDLHGITKIGGIADQYRYLEYIETGEVMENAQTAFHQGFDGFLIGNIADPGLRECREILNVPVLGLCENAILLSCQMGASFSLVTLNEKFTPRIVENVYRLGLQSRMCSTEMMKTDRILALADAFGSESAKQDMIGAFLETANKAVDKGAEVIIPAGGVMMALLAYEGIHDAGRGTPILNGITALLSMGEAMARMNKMMDGRFLSKRLSNAPPGTAQIDEIRKFYGDVYPSVHSKG